MSDAAELSVVIKGREVGLKSLLATLERDLRRADREAAKASEAIGGGLGGASDRAGGSALRLAQAQARLASASGDAAGAVQILERALQGVDRSSLAAINAQTQLARAQATLAKSSRDAASANVALPRTFAGLTDEVQSAAAGMLGLGAALTAVTTVAQSFQDAFNFKAQLDATNASIAVQLRGVRDVGQTYAEAQQYANQYKLTQQEVTTALQASVGILRTSNASVADTFSVLQRLSVLNPAEGIEGAAFAVRELAAGDILSLADRFNVSKDAAYAMRDAIAAGADPIAVVNEYLVSAGVNMDALVVKTQGAVGAQKDLAIAQEQMAIAQAEWAAGPGLAILELQTKATIGLTRVMSGPGGLKEAFAGLVQEWGLNAGQAAALFGVYAAGEGQAAALSSGITAVGVAAQQQAAATAQAAGATNASTDAAVANAGALEADAGAALLSAANNQLLGAAKENLERQAQAAAAGVIASGGNIEAQAVRLAASSSLVDQLTAAYLRLAQASGEADRARRAAEGQTRLAGQAAQTRDLTGGGIGFDAPGRGRRQSDSDIAASVIRNQQELARAEAEGQTTRTGIARTGGGARVKAEQDSNDKLLQAAQDYQERVAQIEADGRRERERAENALRQSQLSGRAGFYAGLASIDDNALRQDLSTRYEAAATEAARIAQTQGADAAQKYLEASRQQIEGEAQIQQQIQEARDAGDLGQAQYLEGVLALQQAANAEELRQIVEQGSAIAAAEAAAYAQREAQYAEHLARMQGIAAANGTTLGATLPTAPNPVRGAPAGGATPPPAAATGTPGKPTPVVDLATPAAVDANGARTEGKLSELAGILEGIKGEIGALRGDVRSLKQSRAVAGG